MSVENSAVSMHSWGMSVKAFLKLRPCALILQILRDSFSLTVKSSPHGLLGTAWSRCVCLYLVFLGLLGGLSFLHLDFLFAGSKNVYVVGLDCGFVFGVYSMVHGLFVFASVEKNVYVYGCAMVVDVCCDSCVWTVFSGETEVTVIVGRESYLPLGHVRCLAS